jgi:hypothetical protein
MPEKNKSKDVQQDGEDGRIKNAERLTEQLPVSVDFGYELGGAQDVANSSSWPSQFGAVEGNRKAVSIASAAV